MQCPNSHWIGFSHLKWNSRLGRLWSMQWAKSGSNQWAKLTSLWTYNIPFIFALFVGICKGHFTSLTHVIFQILQQGNIWVQIPIKKRTSKTILKVYIQRLCNFFFWGGEGGWQHKRVWEILFEPRRWCHADKRSLLVACYKWQYLE